MRRVVPLLLCLVAVWALGAGSPYVPMYPDGSVPQAVKMTNWGNIFQGAFFGNGGGLTNLPGDGSGLSNIVNDALIIDATKFGVKGVWFGTNSLADWFAVSNAPLNDVPLSNVLAYAASLAPQKVAVKLPPGVIAISNDAVRIYGNNTGLIGHGIAHQEGWGANLYLTNYSLIWQKNTNAPGVIFMSAGNGRNFAKDFEICGSRQPLDSMASANYLLAPIYSPRVGVTNNSGFATIGLQIRGGPSIYCGGMKLENVVVSGFRVGLLNEGNDEVFWQLQTPACDVGVIQSLFSVLVNPDTLADEPININAYLSLIETNTRPAGYYTPFNPGCPGCDWGWQLGVPDEITYINPSFGYRQGGLGVFFERGEAVRIINSSGINGPRCYAWVTGFTDLNVDGGNDEAGPYIGTNWVYVSGGGSNIKMSDWRIAGGSVSIGSTLNAQGEDLRAFSLVYAPYGGEVGAFAFDTGIIQLNNITTVKNVVCTPLNQSVGLMRNWRYSGGQGPDWQYVDGLYGVLLTWPATTSGDSPVATPMLQLELSNNNSNNMEYLFTNNLIPFGDFEIERSVRNDYPFVVLGAGPTQQGTNFFARIMTSDPATPAEWVTAGELPRNYSAAKYSGGANGLSNMIASSPMKKLMPVPIMFFSSFVDLFQNNAAFSSQTWVSNTITALRNMNYPAIGLTNIELEDGQYAVNLRNPADNGLMANPSNFPAGFPFTTKYCHTNGFNVGSYMERNNPSCMNVTPASSTAQLMWQDTLSNLVWGFDGVIFDECGTNGSPGQLDTGNSIAAMSEAIRIFNETVFNSAADDGSRITARRGMWLLKTQGSNLRNVVPWESMDEVNVIGVPTAGPGAIPFGTVADILLNIKVCITNWGFFIGPGTFLDPTAFQLGEPLWLTRQILSYYSMLPACLQVGHNALVPDMFNAEWKQVWADPLVLPPYNIYSNNLVEVWLRPCVQGKYGILFFNLNNTPQTVTLNSGQLGVSPNAGFTLRDIWNFTNLTTFAAGNGFSFTVPPTNCLLEVLLPINPSAPFTGPNPPPALCYPANGSVMWVSNNPNVYYGINNTYLLMNNSSGNGWSTQTLLGNSGGSGYSPNKNLTNAVVILDPSALSVSNNTMMTTLYDVSSNKFNFLAHGNNSMPWFTNNPNVLGGKSYLNFCGSTPLLGGGCETNVPTLPNCPMSLFAVCTVPINSGGVMFYDYGAGNFQVFPSGGALYERMGGSQFSGTITSSTNTFQVVEFYLNGASSYINTNNVTCGTGTVGTTPCAGLQIGFGASGVQNIPMSLAWYGVYTNMTQTDRTNLGAWLVAWMNNTNSVTAH